MRIKNDKNFEALAKFYGFDDLKLFEGRLLKVVKKMIHPEDLENNNEEEPFYGGQTVKFVMDKNLQMGEVAKMFTEAVCAEKPQLPEDFLNLVLIGDYDCPHCGGKLTVEDIVERKDNGYFNPPIYKVVGHHYYCPVCLKEHEERLEKWEQYDED